MRQNKKMKQMENIIEENRNKNNLVQQGTNNAKTKLE